MLFVLLIVLLLLAFCFAVMPRMTGRPDYTPLRGWHYAHRGLHDNASDAPENSMAAFEKAIAGGYGAELDVQLTCDSIPVVFHDDTLKRVCGVEGSVQDYTYAELSQFPLFSSDQHIPKFEDVLSLFDGKTPLIVEIKHHKEINDVCALTDALLQKYHGVYCIESFDPRVVKWYRQNRPQVIRGQLSWNYGANGRKETFNELLMHHLLLNFMGRPDFIAYDHHGKRNFSRVLCRRVFKALSVAWTIRSQDELDASRNDFDLFIFEKFIPKD